MFINENTLCKLAKGAYKDNHIIFGNYILPFGDNKEGYFIAGERWGIWIDVNYISNKLKALIIELSGILPDEEECFKVSKDEPVPQLYINETITSTFNIVGFKESFITTPISYMGHRFFQIRGNKTIIAVNESYCSMIDYTKIDYSIEGEPTRLISDNADVSDTIFPVYWTNGICKLFIQPSRLKNDVTEALSSVDFSLTDNVTSCYGG